MEGLIFLNEAPLFFSRHLYRLSFDERAFVFALAKMIPLSRSGVYIATPFHIAESHAINYMNFIAPQCDAVDAVLILFANSSRIHTSEADFNKRITLLQEFFATSPFSHTTVLIAKLFDHITTMGAIRGLIADAILLSAFRNRISDPLIVINDIDVLDISASYIRDMAWYFNGNRALKFVAGTVEYGYRGTVGSDILGGVPVPELFIFNELNKALNKCARDGAINYERRIAFEGANAAVSGAAYCAVGGFDHSLPSGEDDALGRALTRFNPSAFDEPEFDEDVVFRTDSRLFCAHAERCWMVTDPRRVLLAIASGLPGIEAWADLPFMKTIGSSMSSAELASRCATNKELITPQLLAAASKGDSTSQGAVVARVRAILERSISFDRRAQNREQLANILAALGLKATSLAAIEWTESDFFSRLRELVRQ